MSSTDASHPLDDRAPAANPAAILIGGLAGLGLLGLAGVAVHDLIIRAGWVGGTEWLTAATGWVDRLTWQSWMWPASIGLVFVGLGLLWLSIRPRRKEYTAISGGRGLWTRRSDIARRCSSVAAAKAGSASASTVVKRRKVTVTLGARGPVDTVAVQEAVAAELAEIGARQRVSIKLTHRTLPAATNDDQEESA
ncbi:hypothetical protein GOEFS_070_00210 [Gordonia effusa NBRC 100432]|uniref:Alkaline shock response membrane anchor protein AmaP n=1 Tax=Gordonia effusa NBRC 100432 TaxID=1077974 RepID=H0R1I6_9ACTN|nr:hypothetical protein [Gordonia effusa]GAB18937.1 hypothetical protein GOEFS_070_00210 [Gordonia effusa NBRC 100432]